MASSTTLALMVMYKADIDNDISSHTALLSAAQRSGRQAAATTVQSLAVRQEQFVR
jgi:hypothetical protein